MGALEKHPIDCGYLLLLISLTQRKIRRFRLMILIKYRLRYSIK